MNKPDKPKAMSQFTSFLKWFGKLILVSIAVMIVLIIIIAVVKNNERKETLRIYQAASDFTNMGATSYTTMPPESERLEHVDMESKKYIEVNSYSIHNLDTATVRIEWWVIMEPSKESETGYNYISWQTTGTDTLRAQ